MCLFSTELRLFPLHWKAKVGARRLWTQPEVSSPGHQLPSRTFRLDSFHGKYFYFRCWAFNGIQGEFLVMLTKDLSHSYLFLKPNPKNLYNWLSNEKATEISGNDVPDHFKCFHVQVRHVWSASDVPFDPGFRFCACRRASSVRNRRGRQYNCGPYSS